MSNLNAWLDEIGRPQAAVLLGVTPSAIGHWLAGRRRITPDMARKIERVSRGKVTAVELVFGKRAA